MQQKHNYAKRRRSRESAHQKSDPRLSHYPVKTLSAPAEERLLQAMAGQTTRKPANAGVMRRQATQLPQPWTKRKQSGPSQRPMQTRACEHRLRGEGATGGGRRLIQTTAQRGLRSSPMGAAPEWATKPPRTYNHMVP
jgi:hypothetical protein